jgi:hypothetical protein
MAKRVVEFSLESGGSILVEVDEPPKARAVRAGREGELAKKITRTFEDALTDVRPAAESIVAQLRNVADPPDAIEVTFGLKLSVQAGAIIASASGEGNFAVKLSWSRSK